MAKDLYKYYRMEARELLDGLSQGVLEMEKGGGGKGLVGRLLRLAHTLKGASRVVKQPGIAELAHSLEDAFAPYREHEGAIPRQIINQALSLLDGISAKVASLETVGTEGATETPRAPSEEILKTVRVEIDEVDALLHGVHEASVQLTALRRDAGNIARARELAAGLRDTFVLQAKNGAGGTMRAGVPGKGRILAEELCDHLQRVERSLAEGIDLVEGEFSQISDASGRLRLLPAASVFASLERAVRDAAQSLQKDVAFHPIGGENRLDAHVLGALRNALLHVVRNAVAHGIESQQERAAAGKPSLGRVELRVERRGTRLAFLCRDDGRGIDVEAVRRAAVRIGAVAASEASSLAMEEVVRIILKGGVTTRRAVDEVSGRGIGLDVVRETAARLRGEVNIRSEPGRGTSLDICVPVSLSSLSALEVEVGETLAALPVDAVRQVLRIEDHEIARSGARESIVYGGVAIAFVALGTLLGMKVCTEQRRRKWCAIVLAAPSGIAAFGVDRFRGTSSVVVRPLPALAQADAVVAGVSLDAEGSPRLVLDAEGLVAAACSRRAPGNEASAPKRAPVLVVDDSLTTRMLEQNILESAGYEVEVATSGEEALGKARDKHYSLFLVDVEMPGMDGFEFVSRTQADGALRHVPSILVTSRSAPEDRRRGEQTGARDYILKGEFDQGYLLQKIREFVG